MLDRLEPTFATLLRMPRYRGHFYNWYDTRTLAPLPPAYISTVDSGNLAGYLLTLRTGLRAARRATPIIDARRRSTGIDDALGLFEDDARGAPTAAARSQPASQASSTRSAALLASARRRSPAGERCCRSSRDRLAALGVLLHEIEESLPADAPTAHRAMPPSGSSAPASRSRERQRSSIAWPAGRRRSTQPRRCALPAPACRASPS